MFQYSSEILGETPTNIRRKQFSLKVKIFFAYTLWIGHILYVFFILSRMHGTGKIEL